MKLTKTLLVEMLCDDIEVRQLEARDMVEEFFSQIPESSSNDEATKFSI